MVDPAPGGRPATASPGRTVAGRDASESGYGREGAGGAPRDREGRRGV